MSVPAETVAAVAETQSQPLPLSPVGYRILVREKPIQTKSAGGIELPTMVQDAQRVNTRQGTVVAMGALCYTHPKFRTRPDIDPAEVAWCRVGDIVTFGIYSGDSFHVKEGSAVIGYRLLNDDEITGIVNNPTALRGYVD